MNAHEVSYMSGSELFYFGFSNTNTQTIKIKNIKTTQRISGVFLRYKSDGFRNTYEKCEMSLQMIKGNSVPQSSPFLSHKSKNEFNYFSVKFKATQNVQNPIGMMEFHDKVQVWPKDLKLISTRYIPCKCDNQPDVYCDV